jgi:hypothetical protein
VLPHVGDFLVFRWEVIMAADGSVDDAVKAFLIRDGAQLCHVGFFA